MPSTAIGDFRLKYPEFNFHQFERGSDFRVPIPTFTGPYISHKPDIQVFDLTKDDELLILATDGLWDEIKRKETGKIISGNNDDEVPHPKALLEAALNHVTKEKGVSRDYLAQL